MNNYCVYTHSKPNGDVFYIGKGVPKRPYKNSGRNVWWHRVVEKHGSYAVTIVEDALTNDEALELEILLIGEAREAGLPLCNLTDGGEGLVGFKHSEESRRKMRISNRGKTKSGHKLSAEHRQKLSDAHMGKTLSEEHRAILSEAQKGRVVTAETRSKISAALTGKPISEEHKAKLHKPVRCIETGEVFPSVNDACRKLGVHRQNIAKVAKGQLKQTGGYRFEYINKDLTS
jgi:group I intron endonuclease